jgi:hypothetical protein
MTNEPQTTVNNPTEKPVTDPTKLPGTPTSAPDPKAANEPELKNQAGEKIKPSDEVPNASPDTAKTPGEETPEVPQLQAKAAELNQPTKRIYVRAEKTRYTWDIFHAGNLRAPVFTLSLIEMDPEKVHGRYWSTLTANVSAKNVESYSCRLKSIEVLD